jgi:pimeloyl-ACP methyl ester carboxylesterase
MNQTTPERYTVRSKGVGSELDAYLNDIDAVLDHSGPKPPVLFGYSHTAFFATHYALANPARVSALILVEPALFNSREDLLHRAELALAGDNEGSVKAMLEQVQPDVAHDENLANAATRIILRNLEEPRALGKELLVRANHPISGEQLASLPMPVLLVGGTKSHAAYTVHRAAACLPSAYVWWIRDATHGDLMGEVHAPDLGDAVQTFMSAIAA